VTKFLDTIGNDLSTAKFLAQSNGDDELVAKYLQQAMDDIAVTKYMETVISKFLEAQESDKLDLGIDLKGTLDFSKSLESAGNDTSVTKFMDASTNDTSVTKFLN